MSDTEQPRVILWAVFRSCSTAVMQCISNIKGGTYFLEPYTSAAYYGPESVFHRSLNEDTNILPGSEHAYDSSINTFSWVKQTLEGAYPGASLVFAKDHAYGLKVAGKGWENIHRGNRHSFLIRNPNKTFSSWEKVMSDYNPPGWLDDDTSDEWKDMELGTECFRSLLELYQYVRDNLDPNPFVMDADDILDNPEAVMEAYCKATGIPFGKELLEWGPDGEKATGNWITCRAAIPYFKANYHKNALKSRGFSKAIQSKTTAPQSSKVKEIIKYSLPFYDQLYQVRHIP